MYKTFCAKKIWVKKILVKKIWPKKDLVEIDFLSKNILIQNSFGSKQSPKTVWYQSIWFNTIGSEFFLTLNNSRFQENLGREKLGQKNYV